MCRTIALTAASFLLLLSLQAGCSSQPRPVTVTGLVDATEIDVASKVPGRIEALYVREGEVVAKGQKLVAIDSAQIDAKVSQVDAGIKAAGAQLRMARKGARDEEKRAVAKQLEAAQHQVDLTRKMYDRLKPLAEQKAIAQSRFDEIEFKYHVSLDQLAMVQAKYDMVRKGARDEQVEALEALVEQAQGVMQEVQSYEKEMEQYAPIDGEVASIVLHEGELAATGYPIVTLVNLNDLWVAFALREDHLKGVAKGTTITGYVPALDKTMQFTVTSLAVMGDFATWKATGDKDSFDLKSFLVKARPVTPDKGLRPGMTVRWTR